MTLTPFAENVLLFAGGLFVSGFAAYLLVIKNLAYMQGQMAMIMTRLQQVEQFKAELGKVQQNLDLRKKEHDMFYNGLRDVTREVTKIKADMDRQPTTIS